MDLKKVIFLLFIFCTFSTKLCAQESLQVSAAYAQKLMDAEKFEEAESVYLLLLKEDPDNRTYLYNLGVINYNLGKNQKARMYFEKCVELDRNDLDARFLLGYTYFREKNYDKAKEQWQYILQRNPQYYDAQTALARIFEQKGMIQDAEQTYDQILLENPANVEALSQRARLQLRQKEYEEGLEDLQKVYEQTPDNELKAQIIGLKPLVNPSIYTATSYSEETEQDLVLLIKTVRLKTWTSDALFQLPLTNSVRLFGGFHYNQVTQFNIQRGLNNYQFNAYDQRVGFESYFLSNWYLKLQSKFQWARNAGVNVFPFSAPTIWQPSALFRYSDPQNIAWISGYKDTFVARNFDNILSFLVKKRVFLLGYEYRYLLPFSGMGVEGSLNWYKGFLNNKKREVKFWFRYQLPIKKTNFIVSYHGKWGSFDLVDPDYYSYRWQWKHDGKLTWLQIFDGRGLIEFSYMFTWLKERDFVNVAEDIATSINTPQQLNKNVFKAATFELKLKRYIRTTMEIEGDFLYYKNTNEYTTWAGKLKLNWLF